MTMGYRSYKVVNIYIEQYSDKRTKMFSCFASLSFVLLKTFHGLCRLAKSMTLYAYFTRKEILYT